jgi:hypothetical protein
MALLHFLSILTTLATLATAEHYLYGPTWGIRRNSGPGSIISLETTLFPGAPPKPQAARLAIWPGMDIKGGLIQPIIVGSDERLYNGYVSYHYGLGVFLLVDAN